MPDSRYISSAFREAATKIKNEIKTFELRKKEKEYRKGDILELMEFTEGRHTGRVIRAEITYILDDYTGLEDGYCIMAIRVLAAD